MREIYVSLNLSLPCEFWDDSYMQFQDYLESVLDGASISSETHDNLTFKVDRLSCTNFYVDAKLQISGLEAYDTSYDEEEFISLCAPNIQRYIEDILIPQINDLFNSNAVLSALPNAYIVFVDDTVFVQIAPGQVSLELDCYPAEVELTANAEDLASDLYYTDEI
jgi:hypothetical protein